VAVELVTLEGRPVSVLRIGDGDHRVRAFLDGGA